MNGPQKESTILRGAAILVGLLFMIVLPFMLFLEPNDAANDFADLAEEVMGQDDADGIS